jgi:hypothetical protein
MKKQTPTNQLPDLWEAAIKAVAEERANPQNKLSLFDLSFPKQAEFIQDPAKRKSLFCTRRAAKSYTSGLYIADTIEKYHEVNCLYLGLTKDTAMGIIWNDILLKIKRDHELDWHPRESKRDITSKTGSRVFISGADADADEMQKLLGKKYKLIIIDESQAFSQDMRTLVYGILGPTLIDVGGTIVLAGTAGNLTQGLFYDITNSKEPGWKQFSWTALDNPYIAKQWQEELDDIERNRPLFKKTALFKQWYLNQWVIDDDAKVYKYEESRNSAPCLPAGLPDWHYVLGLDLAHSPDSTAFVVGAYNDLDPKLYFVYAHKQIKMDITDVALFIKGLETKFPFEVKVVDGANKQAVAELNNRHHQNLIAADKTGKVDFILLMNDDFLQANIKLLPAASMLADEYKKLIWLTDSNGKILEPKKENPVIHNDLCDGGLYLWRYCHQYLFKPKEPFKDMSLQENWEPAHVKKLEDEVRKKLNPNELELDWIEDWNTQEDDGL